MFSVIIMLAGRFKFAPSVRTTSWLCPKKRLLQHTMMDLGVFSAGKFALEDNQVVF